MKSRSHLVGLRGGRRLNLFNDTGRADWFVSSNNPMVLMKMPGCFRRITNRAHRRWMCIDRHPAKTGKQFFSKLSRIEVKSDPDEICYCEEGPLLIALDRNDCSFERCYDELKNKPFGSVAKSLTFRLVSQKGATRQYEVSRLIALRDDSQKGLSFLEGSITPFPQLRLVIESSKDKKNIFSGTVLLRGKPLFSTGFAAVSVPKNYRVFAGLLEETRKRFTPTTSPADAKKWLRTQSRKLFPNHAQVQSIVTNILRSEDILRYLEKVRGRVFDALPTWRIESQIQEIISHDVLRIPKRKHESYDMRLPMRLEEA